MVFCLTRTVFLFPCRWCDRWPILIFHICEYNDLNLKIHGNVRVLFSPLSLLHSEWIPHGTYTSSKVPRPIHYTPVSAKVTSLVGWKNITHHIIVAVPNALGWDGHGYLFIQNRRFRGPKHPNAKLQLKNSLVLKNLFWLLNAERMLFHVVFSCLSVD